MGFLDYISREWGTISRAPSTFIVGACLIATGTWFGAAAFYSEDITASHQQRDLWKDRVQVQPAKIDVRSPTQIDPTHDLLTPVRHMPISRARRQPRLELEHEPATLPSPKEDTEDHFWDNVTFVRGSTIIGSLGQSFKYSTRGGTFIGNSVAGYDSADVKSDHGFVANNVFNGPKVSSAPSQDDSQLPHP